MLLIFFLVRNVSFYFTTDVELDGDASPGAFGKLLRERALGLGLLLEMLMSMVEWDVDRILDHMTWTECKSSWAETGV